MYFTIYVCFVFIAEINEDMYEKIIVDGKSLIFYNNYTFSKQGDRKARNHYCSQRISRKCKARIALKKTMEIKFADISHSHAPPVLQRIGNTNKFVKLQIR